MASIIEFKFLLCFTPPWAITFILIALPLVLWCSDYSLLLLNTERKTKFHATYSSFQGVCMCVCMYVCVCVCLCMCVHMYICVCMYACLCDLVWVYMYEGDVHVSFLGDYLPFSWQGLSLGCNLLERVSWKAKEPQECTVFTISVPLCFLLCF